MKDMRRIADIWQQQLPKDESELAAFERNFFPIFLQYAHRSQKILEIGAGRGRMVRVLRRYGVKAQFVCLDLNDYVWEAGGLGVIGNAINLPFPDNSFDLVYSLGVVEHFPQTVQALSEHVRVAKVEGIVLVSIPHFSPYTLLRWIVWAIRFRQNGTFEETIGRNIKLRYLIDKMVKNKLNILDSGIGGVFLPAFTNRLNKPVNALLPENHFGAFCWVLGIKTRFTA